MTIEKKVEVIENLLSQLVPGFLELKSRVDTIEIMIRKESLNQVGIGEKDIKELIKRTRS